MKRFILVILFILGAAAAMSEHASASERQGAYQGGGRQSGDTSGGMNVNSPSFALYDPANPRSFDLVLFKKTVATDNGFSAMIGGGLYNVGDTVSGGTIKNITSDSIVVEFPKVVITHSKVDISFKPGDQVEKPSGKPIPADNQAMGDLQRVYYETALAEVQDDDFDQALIAKAISDAMGNQDLVPSLYIKYRVAQLERDHKDAIAKKNKAANKTAILKTQESCPITIVTTIDRRVPRILLKIILPLFLACLVAYGIYIFTEWSKKW